MEAELSELRKAHPWPNDRPNVKPEPKMGWFSPDTQKMVRRHITDEMKLIVELGSFLGRSARAMLDWSPASHVICIDHFKGSSEHHQRGRTDVARFLRNDLMWLTFVYNMWEHRDRCTPMRADTVEGMQSVAKCGLVPDLVYVDASHETPAVLADCRTACTLWPGIRLVGDDYNRGSVRGAVKQFSKEIGRPLIFNEVAEGTLKYGWGM